MGLMAEDIERMGKKFWPRKSLVVGFSNFSLVGPLSGYASTNPPLLVWLVWTPLRGRRWPSFRPQILGSPMHNSIDSVSAI